MNHEIVTRSDPIESMSHEIVTRSDLIESMNDEIVTPSDLIESMNDEIVTPSDLNGTESDRESHAQDAIAASSLWKTADLVRHLATSHFLYCFRKNKYAAQCGW